ncbi:MAG TPA: hypothetical protein VD998_01980, partial [Verrucomicrobiae bacterium]|nr:hypothetical protein [Verrucomicrobiae bacterium]
VKESIYRSYLTNKGVREVEFEQNKDKYMALPGKVVQVGNLKPEDNNDFDKVLKDKSRVDNIKPYVYIPTRKELENMEVEDIRKFNDPNDLAKHAEKVRKVPATVVATAAPTTPATPLETATKQMDDLFPGLKDSAEKAKAAADTQAKAAENLANAQNKAAAAADDEDEE